MQDANAGAPIGAARRTGARDLSAGYNHPTTVLVQLAALSGETVILWCAFAMIVE
ncbi:predicted protein [Plenodomus lingam JN3]|uniref:Predicted protein n=1 Tax=Leptosphaeria maculans (strain JN3 / isolate v23.1.3 / race Av1-4-5-6-7-8) TaxID=985895 RepID=E4ZTB7_LEPMJ|nr:predicted protein [Plenodomus lingam JN3]CBX94773.1 predicted protein [Plenodomus lingam JN3]